MAALPLTLLLGHSAQDPIQLPSAQELVVNSGNLLTLQQAENRLSNARIRYGNGHNNYILTRENPAEYYQNCFQMDYTPEQVPATSRVFFNRSADLRQNQGEIAKALVEHAIHADLFYCISTTLPDNKRGGWTQNSNGVIEFNDDQRYRSKILSTTIHETFHSIHTDQDVISAGNGLTLYDLQMSRLSFEASARVIERLYTFEAHLNGEKTNWLENDEDRVLDLAIQNSYPEQNITDPSAHKRALEHAGTAAWHAVFTKQSWLNHYNKRVAAILIRRYQRESFDPFVVDGYTISNAQMTGRLNDSFNFTRDIEALPAVNDRFGTNRDMALIFQYLQIKQIEQVYGVDNQTYISYLEAAVEQQNPYLAVDLNDIDTLSDSPNVIEQMQALRSRTRTPSLQSPGV